MHFGNVIYINIFTYVDIKINYAAQTLKLLNPTIGILKVECKHYNFTECVMHMSNYKVPNESGI